MRCIPFVLDQNDALEALTLSCGAAGVQRRELGKGKGSQKGSGACACGQGRYPTCWLHQTQSMDWHRA